MTIEIIEEFSTDQGDNKRPVNPHRRPSYGRMEVKEPRQCIFIGTTRIALFAEGIHKPHDRAVIGSKTGTPVDDRDYQVPFAFTGKLIKLTITVEPPKLTPEDEKNWRKHIALRRMRNEIRSA